MKPLPEVLAYYDRFAEETRLQSGASRLELERTKEILSRVLPRPPARVVDVGGAAGVYSAWLAEQVRSGLAALGVESALPAGQWSVVLRAYRLPPGLSYATLHDGLKAEGFVIYAGQGDLSQTLFRISTMGNLTSADMDRFLKCFSRLLR